jgi:hypothetical protein
MEEKRWFSRPASMAPKDRMKLALEKIEENGLQIKKKLHDDASKIKDAHAKHILHESLEFFANIKTICDGLKKGDFHRRDFQTFDHMIRESMKNLRVSATPFIGVGEGTIHVMPDIQMMIIEEELDVLDGLINRK